VSTLTSCVVAVFTAFIVVAFVLASATIGVPSEVSVPLLILLAFITLRAFKEDRRVH
jgi:hypothetical protein